MDIYENIIIGNFLFGLGVAVGAKSQVTKSPPISVNLLQQTPLDKQAGDVLLRGACSMRLLEFKRLQNDYGKEISKLRHLEAALSNQSMADLISTSRKVHWFVESNNLKSKFEVNIRPYLDLENPKIEGPSLNKFIAEFVDEGFSAHVSDEKNFSRYLTLLSLCQGTPNGASGGLIVVVDAEGIFHYAVVEDLRELGLELRRYHDRYLHRLFEQEVSHKRQIELERIQQGLDEPKLGGMSR